MLDKKYDSKLVEEGKYQTWLKNDYFKSVDQGSLSDIKLYHDIRKESIYD